MLKQDSLTQIYKSEDLIDEEFVNAKELTPKDLELAGFFGSNRNFFIQVIKDSEGGANKKELNPHYFHLKRLCRKKS